MDPTIRPATPEDVPFLVPLFNEAGHGMPLYFWTTRAQPGEDPWEVGRREIRSGDTGFSWRTTWIAELSGRPAGVLSVYLLPPAPDPEELAALPPMVRAFVELEAEAAGTAHVQFLSVLEDLRGQGVGTALLRYAERCRGPQGMSLIITNDNLAARRLYERHGYTEAARRRIVKNGFQTEAMHYVLMRKP